MMSKSNLSYSIITVILSIVYSFFVPLKAQNVDDLPNDPQQLRTWQCSQTDKTIAVEAKDVPIWKDLIEGGGWKCDEQVPNIPADKPTFSCEPQEIIGILTVFWLGGKGGKDQMTTWMNELANTNNMTCTLNETNKYWE